MLPFLLALQASGMVVDWFGRQNQIDMAERGAELQQEMIERNIQLSRIQTADESLREMVKLRQNLGTQAAMFAARGVAGPMVGLAANESVGNFNTDERMRRINQLSNEAKLRAGIEISKLHQKTFETNQRNEFFKSAIEKIPTSPDAWKGFGESFGMTKARPIG